MRSLPLRLIPLTLAVALSSALAPAQSCFDPISGVGLGLATNALSAQSLGFSLPVPGGGSVTTISIDSHGRILLGPGGSSDSSPTVPELVGTAQVCPFWAALDPSAAASDDVRFFSDGFARAIVTWNDIVLLGASSSDPFRVQAVLYADGRITFAYSGQTPDTTAIVGISAATGSAPAPVDLSATEGQPFDSSGVATIYESFSPDVDIAGKRLDFFPNGNGYFVVGQDCGLAAASTFGVACGYGQPSQSLGFDYTSLPRIGASFDLSIDGITPTTNLAVILVGSVNLDAPLSVVFPSNPCVLYSSNDLGSVPLLAPNWDGIGDTDAVYSLDLSTATAGLVGLEAVFQVVTADPGVPWGAGVGVMTSEAVIASFGL